ncbi:MAG: hypothetical protein IJB61_11905, partial [Bacteroides sp]|nr:hypothetical protein [Bacteroides sp.]
SINFVHRKQIIKEIIMARPIKETPILYGKDAERFIHEMENVKPASEEEKKRVRASYEKIKKLATFMM